MREMGHWQQPAASSQQPSATARSDLQNWSVNTKLEAHMDPVRFGFA